jgi:protoheme IX farnesyltransferase
MMRQRLADYLELTKPRLTLLVLLTTAVGYWMGAVAGQPLIGLVPLIALTALVAGGVNALNMWLERDYDALMQRTQGRPLPAGRLQPREAFWFGISLVALGSLGMLPWVSLSAALLAFLSAVTYVWGYTPLKRKTSLCTLVGAVPGALPILIGWTAARGYIGLEGWTLFCILFLWQLPHFLALAVLFREDYQRAGFRMLPLDSDGGPVAARQMVLYTLVLIPLSVLPSFVGLTGGLYLAAALVLGAFFAWVAFSASRITSRAACRRLFLTSIAYLPLLLLTMSIDKR